MRSVLAMLFALLLTGLVEAAGAASDTRAETIAPFLDELTFAVICVDLERFDPKAFSRMPEQAHQAFVSEFVDFLQSLGHFQASLRATGAKEMYLVLSLADLPEHPPFLIAPFRSGTSADALAKALHSDDPHRPTFVDQAMPGVIAGRIANVVFCGAPATRERIRSLNPLPQPSLAEAFAAAGSEPIQVVVLPSADMRRVADEALSALAPAQPAGIMARGFRWAALGLGGSPQKALHLVLHTATPTDAKSLLAYGRDTARHFANAPAVREFLHERQYVKAELRADVHNADVDLTASGFALDAWPRILAELFNTDVDRPRATYRLREIGLAMHQFHDLHTHFPAAAICDKQGKPLLSWRVEILPLIGQKELFSEFRRDEPWDSEHNRSLIARMPSLYQTSARLAKEGKTTFLGIAGEGGMFQGCKALTIQDVRDGTSNTIWVVDANYESSVIWTQPSDYVYDRRDPLTGVRGRYPKGFLALFVDDSVRFLPDTLDRATVNAYFTCAGGEIIPR